MWKDTKGTIFIESTIDLQFETDSAGNCPTVCKLGGMIVGGAWGVFERVVNLPNPKAKLPLSWYSSTPSSKQHDYECSITCTSTPKNETEHQKSMHATALSISFWFYG
jgi:hypothetical protein